EQPNKPDTPEQPNKPDTPEQPSKPDTPEQPSNNGKYNNKEENKKLNFDNNHSQTNAKVVIRKHSNNPYGNLQNHNHSSKLPQTGENIIISLLISFFGITILTILIFRKISLNKKKR
ncbi:LPXTG cell wall anchor domain-containing protein, partial [Apilactobacillus ozensis]